MNPNTAQQNSNQQETQNQTQNTQPQQQNQTTQTPQSGDLSNASSLGSSPTPSLSEQDQQSQGQNQSQNGQQQAPQSTYQVPTVGMPTSSTFGSANSANGSDATHKKPTPKGNTNGSKLMPLLYIIGGIIFLVAYTIVWAVVFGLSIPFLPF